MKQQKATRLKKSRAWCVCACGGAATCDQFSQHQASKSSTQPKIHINGLTQSTGSRPISTKTNCVSTGNETSTATQQNTITDNSTLLSRMLFHPKGGVTVGLWHAKECGDLTGLGPLPVEPQVAVGAPSAVNRDLTILKTFHHYQQLKQLHTEHGVNLAILLHCFSFEKPGWKKQLWPFVFHSNSHSWDVKSVIDIAHCNGMLLRFRFLLALFFKTRKERHAILYWLGGVWSLGFHR